MSMRFSARVFKPVYKLEEALDSIHGYDILQGELAQVATEAPVGEEVNELNEYAAQLLQEERRRTAASLVTLAAAIKRPVIEAALEVAEKKLANRSDGHEPGYVTLYNIQDGSSPTINLQPLPYPEGSGIREKGKLAQRITRVKAVLDTEIPGFTLSKCSENIPTKAKIYYDLGARIVRAFAIHANKALTAEELAVIVSPWRLRNQLDILTDDETVTTENALNVSLGHLFNGHSKHQYRLMKELGVKAQIMYIRKCHNTTCKPLEGSKPAVYYIGRHDSTKLQPEDSTTIKKVEKEVIQITWGKVAPPTNHDDNE